MNHLEDLNLEGEKALIRVDFNVPIKDGQIEDDTRMQAALPTIQKVLNKGGSVVLMSHWGRPLKELKADTTKTKKDFSLQRIVKHLSDLLERPVQFASNCIGPKATEKAEALQPGEVLLLENLRFHPEEKKGDEAFAKQLATLGTVYINDAFGTAHRAHASTATIAQYFDKNKRCFGILMRSEIEAADKVFKTKGKRLTAVIGGAKVSDKILILENLIEKAKNVLIGGGMAYTFIKALGGEIGNSLCEEDHLETARELLRKAAAKEVNIFLPDDSVIANHFANDAQTKTTKSNQIPDGWMGLDIGALAAQRFRLKLLRSDIILWNGPMGVFEMEQFQKGTKAIAEAVVEATAKGSYSLVGGGDSVAAVNKFNFADQVSYVSTGGGALLSYFEGKELPGIAAIRN